MKKHSTANILLMELLVVILFFMLCVSTLVEVFGAARSKSIFARAENAASCLQRSIRADLQKAGLATDHFVYVGNVVAQAHGEDWLLRRGA